jgi:hypothetical protein
LKKRTFIFTIESVSKTTQILYTLKTKVNKKMRILKKRYDRIYLGTTGEIFSQMHSEFKNALANEKFSY